MVGKRVRFVVLTAIGWLTTANIGCDNATPIEPYTTPYSVPPLTDAIPYEALGQGTLVFHRTGPEDNSWSGIYVIDIDQQSSWGIGGLFHGPVVSSDGQQIAYTAYAGWEAGTVWDVHVMNIDGTDAQNVSNLEYQDRFASWTPDGLKILFWVARNPDRIYMQSPVVDPTDRVVVSDTSVSLWLSGRVSASSTGGIAFVGQLGDSLSGLFTAGMDGNDAKLLDPKPSDFVDFESPAFSPDGQTIAYLSATRDSTWSYQSIELLLIGIDGTERTSVALLDADGQREWHNPGQRNAVSICWSPDGSKLLFNRPEGDLVAHIYVINSDGSGLTRVTSAEGITDRSVSWSN